MRRIAPLAAGLLAALAVAGCSASAASTSAGAASLAAGGAAVSGAGAQAGTVRDCEEAAYSAIRAHVAVTGLPSACQGLSRAQVNDAASTAIRQAAGSGPKSVWRKRAGAAAPWVASLLTGPVPPPVSAPAAGLVPAGALASGSPGSRLGGVSELAVQVAALLAWLATALSGGYVLARWLRAGGSLRQRSVTAAPPAMAVAHAGLGVVGLVLWVIFMLTGWAAVAWTTVIMLGPVAGLGMGVLLLGLPSLRPADALAGSTEPGRTGTLGGAAGPGGTATLVAPPVAAAARSSRPRVPVFVIAAHGLFATTVLILVITATIGAG